MSSFLGFTDIQSPVIIAFDVIIAFVVTSLCHQCLLSQAVPKKKKDSGRKVLAKILTQILADCKKADGLTPIWWKVFSVSFTCHSRCNTKTHKPSLITLLPVSIASRKSGVRFSSVCVSQYYLLKPSCSPAACQEYHMLHASQIAMTQCAFAVAGDKDS